MNRVASILSSIRSWLRAAPIVVLLLIGSATASILAWSLQASAAADLQEARRVQERDTTAEGGKPPSPEQNREIIASLNESIAVRQLIDEQLQRIEASVQALSGSQRAADAVTVAALSEIERIAAELGGAGRAARSAVGRLGQLEAKLRSSARLADLIADELAELDRKMGPSAGRP